MENTQTSNKLYIKYRRFGSSFITYFTTIEQRDKFIKNLYNSTSSTNKKLNK